MLTIFFDGKLALVIMLLGHGCSRIRVARQRKWVAVNGLESFLS